MTKRNENGYKDALKDEAHLATFLRNMADFDHKFCDMMFSGVDFTLLLEVHGNSGKLVHCRVKSDSFDRVPSSAKNKPKKNNPEFRESSI